MTQKHLDTTTVVNLIHESFSSKGYRRLEKHFYEVHIEPPLSMQVYMAAQIRKHDVVFNTNCRISWPTLDRLTKSFAKYSFGGVGLSFIMFEDDDDKRIGIYEGTTQWEDTLDHAHRKILNIIQTPLAHYYLNPPELEKYSSPLNVYGNNLVCSLLRNYDPAIYRGEFTTDIIEDASNFEMSIENLNHFRQVLCEAHRAIGQAKDLKEIDCVLKALTL